ncbi:MAG: TRAP transporter small permease [Burkholderiales bacterium]|nr:TRAP transporter small permease [Burkholderiales bacterium]
MNRFLNHLEEWLIAFLIGAATLVIFFAVLHRFLSGLPYIQDLTVRMNVSWAQELCIFMFVWMAKFGAAYGVRTGIHVGVDVIIRKLTGTPQRMLILFGLLAGALFTGTVATLGANFVYHIAQTDQVSADLEVPMWWVYLCVPLGSSLMCYRFLQVAWSFGRGGELPHHDHGHVEGVEDATDDPLLATTKGARA